VTPSMATSRYAAASFGVWRASKDFVRIRFLWMVFAAWL